MTSLGTYMGWQDTNAKRPVAQKIAHGAERYRQKHGVPPDHCLCNPADAEQAGEIPGLTVQGRTGIQRNLFYLGQGGGV